jgi:hypothetical protein
MKSTHLFKELCAWLDEQNITSENIGQIRRQLFVPWSSEWNAIVRDETASRENIKIVPSITIANPA